MINSPATTDKETSNSIYRVLARKYRPRNFDDLIGQEAMVKTLSNSFNSQKIAQAWMLTGVRGVGKTTTARILARALNYQTDTIDSPSIELNILGHHCQSIMDGNHIDVVEMDAASHTGIDNIREIIEQIRYKPVSARYKVYIIDEVHMLSTQAFNGLLKTLEEPPDHVKFIFATTEIRKVPITILSRCQRFDLRRVDPEVLISHLAKIAEMENISATTSALAIIARASEGSVRDALSIFDQAIAHSNGNVVEETLREMLGLSDQSQTIELFEYLVKGDVSSVLEKFNHLYSLGAESFTLLSELTTFTHYVTRLKYIPQLVDNMSLSNHVREKGKEFADKLSTSVLSRMWQMLIKGLEEVKNAPHPHHAAEMLLIRIAYAADLPPLDVLLQQISENDGNINTANTNKTMNRGSYPSIDANNSQSNFQSGSAYNFTADTKATAAIVNVNKNSMEKPAAASQENYGNSSIALKQESKVAANSNISTGALSHKDISGSLNQDATLSSVTTLMNEVTVEAAAISEELRQEHTSDNYNNRDFADSVAANDINYEPAYDSEGSKKPININDFKDILELLEQNGESKLNYDFKNHTRFISLQNNRLTIFLEGNVDKDYVRNLEKKLKEWTGEAYYIIVEDDSANASPTIKQQQINRERHLKELALKDSDIKEILNSFPSSEIISVY